MRSLREGLALAGLVFQIAVLRFFWDQMPRQIPTHFNGSGTPDGFGDKSTLIFLPVLSVLLYAMMTAVSFFPQSFNYPVAVTDQNRPRLQAITVAMLGWLKAELTCTLAYVVWGSVEVAIGRSKGLGIAFLPIMLGAVGITIAVSILSIRRAA